MHVCQVITRLIIGGAQENTLLTCRGLIDKGYRVTLISGPQTGPEGSLWNQASRLGCRVLTVDSLGRAVQPIHDWHACRQLKKIFKQLRPDVVHTHTSKAGILGRVAAARAGIKIVVHTIHGMSFNRTQPLIVRSFFRLLERRVARHTSAFITVARAMTDQAVEAGLAPPERFSTIPSGMQTDCFEPQPSRRASIRESWGVQDDEVVVGTIARLFHNKGYEEIITAMPQALQRFGKLKFVWIGDGSLREQYQDRLAQLALDHRVHMVGLVDPESVPALINGFDIVLHASRWEGLPRAVVQGLLTERPAISFDNDGAPEVVLPNETGILVPYGDTSRLADAMVTLASDADLRQRLGRRGRALCLERFDWKRMVEQIDGLYQKLAGSRINVQE